MENVENSFITNNSMLSENTKTINITKVYDSLKLNKQRNKIERENKILLENNFCEPSTLVAYNYSLEKLFYLFESIKFRVFILGTRNSHHYEMTNCLIGKSILIDVENIIIIIKKKNNLSDKAKLFKSELSYDIGLDFKETELLCEGDKEIREKLKNLDKELDISELILIDDLHKYVYILYEDISMIDNMEEEEYYRNNEILIFPDISIDNFTKINKIINDIIQLDHKLLSDYDNIVRVKLIQQIKPQNSIDAIEIEDVYFRNFIFNRKIKRNITVKVINTDNLLSKVYLDYFCDMDNSNKLILHDSYVINSMENIPADFVLNMGLNCSKLSDSLNESFESSTVYDSDVNSSFYFYKEDSASFVHSANLLKDKKISNEIKSEINKRLISKIIVSNIKGNKLFNNYSAPISIHFVSSFYSLLSKVSNTNSEDQQLAFEERLYNERIENNIYKTFDEFKEMKLNFLKKKSEKFQDDYKKFVNGIVSCIRIYHNNEINHFNSACKRYTMIINDILNIPIKFSSRTLQLENEVDLEATLLIYKKLIETEYDEYNNNLIIFYSDFAKEFEKFYTEEIGNINKWCKSLVIYSSSKIEALTSKYKNLLIEMKLKLDNYVNEIIERDMKFIINVKAKLGEVGYLNEFLAKYLSNIQYSLSLFDYNCCNFADDETLKHFLFTVGFNGGISLASGLATFGFARAVTIIGADAASGSSLGPIGTIAGATVGALSLLGTSVFTIIKNKKKLVKKMKELEVIADEFRNIIYDKILEFRVLNKEEMEIRLKKMLSYVELSVRKSFNFLQG